MKDPKEIQQIKARLSKIEKELEKARTADVRTDGWQTQRYARKARAWDMLAQEKFKLQGILEDLENE